MEEKLRKQMKENAKEIIRILLPYKKAEREKMLRIIKECFNEYEKGGSDGSI